MILVLINIGKIQTIIKAKIYQVEDIGLEEVEKIIDEYIKSNTNISNSLLTISDGDIGSDKSI